MNNIENEVKRMKPLLTKIMRG